MPLSTARATAFSGELGWGNPSHGAALIARNPSATARLATAAKPSGCVARGAVDVGVDGKSVPDLASEQDMRRHVECFAGQVPQRLLDGAECGRGDEPLARHRFAALPVGLDLEW